MISELMRSVDVEYQDFQERLKDLDMESWPLMAGPGSLLVIISSYLFFVLWLGPRFMELRKPYNLRTYLIFYNLFQVIMNTMLFLCAVKHGYAASLLNYLFFALIRDRARISYDEQVFAFLGWWFVVVKVIELLDTVHFIFTKKYEHISFLHVYHHASVCFVAWFTVKYTPVEQVAVVAVLNTLVHIVMYTYYLLAVMGKKYRKYLWWKKYVTVIQLVQFAILMVYMTITLLTENNLIRIPSYIF